MKKVNRVEQTQIRRNHPMWKVIDEYCYRSKNLYNYANYIVRQEYINNKKWIRDKEIDKMLQSHETYTELGSQAAQKTLQLLDRNWKSFFVAIKDWSKHSDKYLGRPKLPKYKNKDGRNIVMLKNIQCRIENDYLIFSWKPLRQFKIKTNVKGKLMQVRFIPRGSIYIMEIVYEKEVKDVVNLNSRMISIDLGLNNFVTIANNIGAKSIIVNGKGIKSYNQYWNKQISNYRSLLKTNNNLNWSKRLADLTTKRNNKINYFLHKTSKNIIDYCTSINVDTLIIGYNKGWKQESKMGKINNQNFEQIPYELFIQKLQYKCEDAGINFITTEESYTSGTSFLDNELPIRQNYNKSRRIKRGLFQSNKGILINSDLNGAYQIMKKVFPNAFANGIVGVDLHPVVINI